MASVVTFWQLPEEEPLFLDYLESTGDIVGIPWCKVPDRALLEPRPLRTLISQEPDSVLVGLREVLAELPINTFNEDGSKTYAVATSKVPMLMYSRGQWQAENKLGRSNIAADWTTFPKTSAKSSINPKHLLSGVVKSWLGSESIRLSGMNMNVTELLQQWRKQSNMALKSSRELFFLFALSSGSSDRAQGHS